MAMNSRITIRQRAAGEDALGGQPAGGWVHVVDLWANIRHPSGLQTLRGDADLSVVKASIRVWRRAGITAAMQAVHGSTVYDIKAVLAAQEDPKFMDLVCEAVQ